MVDFSKMETEGQADISVNSLETGNNDPKKSKKAVFRRTIDYNAAVVNYLRERIYAFDWKERGTLQADYLYNFKWTPEGRRLITGAFSGEFTLWNGLTFNFETILQAHEAQIRCMKWSYNDEWLLTADHSGYVKYWQENMNNVEVYQAHKEPIRGVSFSPFDSKFATCSDDSTVRIWDFNKCSEERVLRGHGADVRCVAWHPQMSLIISGSKDAQQPIKLWEPKTGEAISTLYVHKSTCTDVAWNKNGNWFLTASRDHSVKLFDIRNLRSEIQTFRGHKRDVMRVSWHPIHENVFCSGSGDGAIFFWAIGSDTELSAIDDAHESMIWSLAWHPLGHILVSGANDFQTKFWTRDRPGDLLKEGSNGTSTLALHNPINYPCTKNPDQSINNSILDDSNLTDENILAQQRASKLPDFVPFKAEQDDVAFQNDPTHSAVSIPGLNEGAVENLNVLSANASDEKKRSCKSIPKDFAANWASASLNVIQRPAPVIPPHQQENMMAMAVGMAAVANSVSAMKVQMENERNRVPYGSYNDSQPPMPNGNDHCRPYPPEDNSFPPGPMGNQPPMRHFAPMPPPGPGNGPPPRHPNCPPSGMPPPRPMRGPPPPHLGQGGGGGEQQGFWPPNNHRGDGHPPHRPHRPPHHPHANIRGPPPPGPGRERFWPPNADDDNVAPPSRPHRFPPPGGNGPPPHKYSRGDDYYPRGHAPPPHSHPPRHDYGDHMPPASRGSHNAGKPVGGGRDAPWQDRGGKKHPPPNAHDDPAGQGSSGNLPPRREWADRGQRPPPNRRDW